MRLKEVIICGAYSYDDETKIEDFHPGLNVFIGRNGSGKTNIFQAIQFVLSVGPVGSEETVNTFMRDMLAYSSSSDIDFDKFDFDKSEPKETFVELCFHDPEKVFSLDTEEVRIRRKILETDSAFGAYTLNGKSISKRHANAYIEQAGLAFEADSYIASPFIYVPQGHVDYLASASAKERMLELRDVFGVEKFAERMERSKGVLEEFKTLRQKAIGSTDDIRGQQVKLIEVAKDDGGYREFKHELNVIHARDLSREIFQLTESIDQLYVELSEIDTASTVQTSAIDRVNQNMIEADTRSSKAKATLQELEYRVELAKIKVFHADNEIDAYRSRNFNALSSMDAIQLDPEPTEEPSFQEAIEGSATRSEVPVKDLKEEVLRLRADVEETQAKVSAMRAEVKPLLTVVNEAKERRHQLFMHLGLSQSTNEDQVAASNASKASLELVLNDIKNMLEKKREHREEILSQLDIINTQKRILNEDKASTFSQIRQSERREQAELLNIREAEERRQRLQDERSGLDSLASDHLRDANNAAQLLANKGIIPRDVIAGAMEVQELVERLNLGDKYHGVLAELIDIDPANVSAVVSVLPSALLYHVIDDAKTVSEVLPFFKNSAHSAVFMPLAELVTLDTSRDEALGDEAVPLVSFVKAKEALAESCIRLVWGNYLLANDNQTALRVAQEAKRPCITPDGDIFDFKGAISGGYLPPIDAADCASAARGLAVSSRSWKKGVISDAGLSTQIDTIDSEIIKLYSSMYRIQDELGQLKDNLRVIDKKMLRLEEEAKTHDSLLSLNDASIVSLRENHAAIKQELCGFERKSPNSSPEQIKAEIQELNLLIDSNRAELGSALEKLQVVIDKENKACSQLSLQESQLLSAQEASSLREQERSEAGVASGALADLEKRAEVANENLRTATRARDELKAEIEEISRSQGDLEAEMQEALGELTLMDHARSGLLDELRAKIRLREGKRECLEILGVDKEALRSDVQGGESHNISAEAYNKLKFEIEKLIPWNYCIKSMLRLCAYSIDNSEKTLVELESDEDGVMGVLDKYGSHTSESLFQAMLEQVKKKFSEVFMELTGLDGRLVTDRVSARFDVEFGRGMEKHMSHGEAAMCSLALIFAVQRCFPAPFYLFDEIDANLDKSHRIAVAECLAKMGRTSQVLCTTFKPEIAAASDQRYGVSYDKRSSSIELLDLDLALSFLKRDSVNEDSVAE